MGEQSDCRIRQFPGLVNTNEKPLGVQDLMTLEWVGFKLTFLEKDICHDHEIDLLTFNWDMFKKCAIPTDLDFGVLSIKSMFLYFSWAKHKPQLKFFYRDMVYIFLIHLLNQVA